MSNKLSDEEIITFMKEMFAINLNREQLINPTKDVMIGIYARFLAEFGVENVSQPDIIATTGMENIERYESNIILWNIYKSVANIVSSAGIPDMSLSDIILPKRIRTNRILSILCFLSAKLSNIEYKWTQMEKKCIDLPLRRHTIEEKIKDMNKCCEQKSLYLSNNRNKNIAFNQELKSLAQIYEQKKTSADQMTEDSRSIKRTLIEKREKLSEIDVEISKNREELQELNEKIVKSPDRVQNELKEKETELESKRNEKKKFEKQYIELMRKMDDLKEISKSLIPSLDTFSEVFKDIELIRKECQELHAIKAENSNKEKKLRALNVQLKEHDKSVNTLNQKIINNDKQFEKQLKTVKQINKELKDKLENKTKNMSDEEKSLSEEKIKFEKKLEEIESEHKLFKQKSKDYYEQHLSGVKNLENIFNTRLNEYRKKKK